MGMMHDVTRPIKAGMTVWPGDPGIEVTWTARMDEGASHNQTRLCLGSHTGTHVDAPLHFVDRAGTVDSLPLEALTGPVKVIEVMDDDCVRKKHLDDAELAGCNRVFFKTRNSEAAPDAPFDTSYVYVSAEAAEELVAAGVVMVGVDGLSVAMFREPGGRTHRILLEGGVVVVEGLDLRGVAPGDYEVMCLPLLVAGVEGAPARVVLKEV